MPLRYEAEQIKKILTDFSDVTEIDIRLLDQNMNLVAGCEKNGAFCLLLQNKYGIKECYLSDKLLLERARETKKPAVHICHAGLVDIAVPIIKDTEIAGYIIFGRIRNAINFESVFHRISGTPGEYSSLEAEFSRQRCYHDSQIESIVNLGVAIVALILSRDLIREEYQTLSEQIDAYIEQNLGENLSVEHLCRQAKVSKNALYAHFHDSFGCSVTEYIVLKRVEKAKYLLCNSDLPISEVAQRTGIGDYSYFFKLLKKNTGMTPTQYRMFASAHKE